MQLRGAVSAASHLQQRLRSVLAVQEAAAIDPNSPHVQPQSAEAAGRMPSDERQQSAALASAIFQHVGTPTATAEGATAADHQQQGQQQAPEAAASEQQRDGRLGEEEGQQGTTKHAWREPRGRQQQPGGARQPRQWREQQQAGQDGGDAKQRRPGPRGPREGRPPREGRWWRHVPLRQQDKPNRLVPILLHHTDTSEEVRSALPLSGACSAGPDAGRRWGLEGRPPDKPRVLRLANATPGVCPSGRRCWSLYPPCLGRCWSW